MSETESAIRKFLGERFGAYRDDIGADESLDGVVDSLGMFDLVEFIEQDIGVSIPNEDFSPRNFATISSILALIEQCRAV